MRKEEGGSFLPPDKGMRQSVMAKTNPRENVTEGAMKIVGEVVKKANTHDRSILLERICDELEERYPGESLEYHLSQMHISSTADIAYAIDMFFVMDKIFPAVS